MSIFKKFALMGMVGFVAVSAVPAYAAEEITIVIKDHKFEPSEIEVPPGEKIKLVIDNQDATPEEFESHDLNREKIIQGNSKGVVMIGPLKEGSYSFFGEFNEATAQGMIVVKAPGSEADQNANGVEASAGTGESEAAEAAASAPASEAPAGQPQE